MTDDSQHTPFAPGPGEIRYISEAEKAFRGRDVLRQHGVLPAETSPGEWVFAVFDAAANDWFSGPGGRLRLTEALAHAWVATSVPTLHMRQDHWRAAFDEAASAPVELDMALPGNARQIQVFRGCPSDRRDGLSWTTDLDTAAWFACRASKVGVIGEVYTAVAPAEAVIVDLRRFSTSEGEVLVRPEQLRDVTRVEVNFEEALDRWYRKALRIAADARAQGLVCDDPQRPDLSARVGDDQLPDQSIDSNAPRYVAPHWTPENVIWPSPAEAKIIQLGDGLMVDYPFRFRE